MLFNFWHLEKFPELLPAETKREEPAQVLIYFDLVPVTVLCRAAEGEEAEWAMLGDCFF